MKRNGRQRRARSPRGVHVVPDPIELFNQLPDLRGRLVGVYLELTTEDLFAILGQIAVLGVIVDSAEAFAARMREERTMVKLRALQGYARERRFLAEKVALEPAYIPPPVAAPARRRLSART